MPEQTAPERTAPERTASERTASGPLPDDLCARLTADAEAIDRGLQSIDGSIRLLADAGLLQRAAGQPSQAGLFATLFALGGASLPVARLFEGHVDALGIVGRCGGPAARARALRTAAGGGLLGVWGADAPEAPAHVQDLADGSVRLTGAKAFASGLGTVALAVVTARDAQGGTRALLLAPTDPARQDVTSWDMDGMIGSASGRYDLDGLTVAAADQLGRAGVPLAEPHFHGGLWRLCAAQAGSLDALARLLSAHLAERGQDGDPLQRLRLAHAVLAAGTARLWAERAASAMGPGARDDAIETVLFAREAVEKAAGDALEQCERAAGTAMHRRGSAMGRTARDLRLYLRQATLDSKLDYALKLWAARHRSFACDEIATDAAELPGIAAVWDGSGPAPGPKDALFGAAGSTNATAFAGNDCRRRADAGLPA